MKDFLDSLTVRIRIVVDCGRFIFQTITKLKRDTTAEFTTEPAIIFIHCVCPA